MKSPLLNDLIRDVKMISKFFTLIVITQALTASLLLGSESLGQGKSVYEIDIALNHKASPLLEVFDDIELKSGFSFTYHSNVLRGNEKVTLKGSSSLGNFLEHISMQTSLSFKRIDDHIHVVKESEKDRSTQKVKILEEYDVSGKVTDENGQAMPGVTLKVKGTTRGTITDVDGNFKLALQEKDVLVVSFIGYKAQEINVNGRSLLNIQMEVDITSLDEVVVVGYGTQRKVDVTGAVSSIKSESIEKSAAISVDQALQGRIAGVQMTTNTGMPGGGSSIQIRGIKSLNMDSEPIYIIDGVMVNSGTGEYETNAFASINPSDIESVDVLKDASALAIYGAQAANGVIIITTKQGREGKPRITFDTKISNQVLPRYMPMMNLREYAEHQNEIYELRGWGIGQFSKDPSLLSEGTDWQKEIFRPALMQNYNLGISGGNTGTTYKVNISYADQEGIAAGSGFKRLYVSTGLRSKLNNWLETGTNLTFSNTEQVVTIADWNIINSALRQTPSVPARNLDGTYGGPEDENDGLSNPLALAELIDRGNERTGGRGNVFLTVKPLKWLTVKTEMAADINVRQSRLFIPTYELGGRTNGQITNRRELRYDRFLSWKTYATANYKFGRRSSGNVMLGTEMIDRSRNDLSGQRFGGSNNLPDLNAGDALTSLARGYTNRSAMQSFYGRLFYAFDDKYLVTFNLRRDGTSNFAKGNRWGTFPSASIGWKLHKESFLSGVRPINEMKIRAGWGVIGNSRITPFRFAGLLSNVPSIWGNAYITGNVPNPTLQWETTTQLNLGLDLGLFTNRLRLTAEVYDSQTDDLLMTQFLPFITGAGGGQGSAAAPWANTGSIRNRGVELTLNTVNLERKDFQWSSDFTFTVNRNKVLKLNDETAEINRRYDRGRSYIVTQTKEGGSVGEFFGYGIVGRVNSAEDLVDTEGNILVPIPEGLEVDRRNGVWVGDYIWEDYNMDSVINEEDAHSLGSPLPKFTYGFGQNFAYKSFSLSLFFNGSYGNKLMNFFALSIENPESGGNLTRRAGVNFARIGLYDENGSEDDIHNVYVVSGDPTMARISHNDANDNQRRITSRLIEDGSYLRLQNISLTYTANKDLVGRIGLASLRITASVKNAYTWTKYSGFDPEVGMGRDQYSNYGQDPLLNGFDAGRYPSPRIYTLGVSIGL